MNAICSFFLQVIYCFVPKAGCSTWKRTIARSYTTQDITVERSVLHSDRYLRARGMRRLSTYSVNGIQSRLKKYFKFLIVRHPMERLVSAFGDKFELKGVDAYFAAYARKIRERGKDSNLSFKVNLVLIMNVWKTSILNCLTTTKVHQQCLISTSQL